MKIYVLGDFGLDQYHIGRVRGLSAEVPIPVVTVTSLKTLPAMAGNVLQNLLALGMDAIPLEKGTDVESCPVKNRLMTESGQQLARWDERDVCTPYTTADLVPLMHADAVVVADYGKGAITPALVEVLKHLTIPVFVDTKSDPTPWIGAQSAILFPNLSEYKQYEKQYQWIGKVLLKQGSTGMSYLEFGKVILACSAWADFVTCVNGAGDTVLAAFTAATMTGLPVQQVIQFSAAAAANVVEQPFLERTTTVEEIVQRLADCLEESPVAEIECACTVNSVPRDAPPSQGNWGQYFVLDLEDGMVN